MQESTINEKKPLQFDLSGINDEKELIIGIQKEESVMLDKISKIGAGSIQFKILPGQQNPLSTPIIKIPLSAKVFYPSVEFRACSQSFLLEK